MTIFLLKTLLRTPAVLRLLCDRHYGVGADGLVIIGEPDDETADIQISNF